MSSAIWTVIINQSHSYRTVYEYAHRDPKMAKNQIEKKHAGCTVVAIILGRHSSTYTFKTYEVQPHEVYGLNSSDHNNPTGGSD
jgi:hypothetical protein